MASLIEPYYGLLIFGIWPLVLAVNATCTGEAWARFGRVVHRTQKPDQFWGLVAIQYLAGIGFVGYVMFKLYVLSH